MLQTARQRTYYILADFLSASLAWFLFNIIRYYTLPYNYLVMSLSTYLTMRDILLGQLLLPLMMVALYAVSGYYNKVFFKSRLDDVLNSLGWTLAGSVIIFFLVLFNDKIDDRLGNVEMVLILWGLMAVCNIIPRVYLTHKAESKIRNREIAFNAFIIGTSARAAALAEDLEHKHSNMGFRVAGFVDPESKGVRACSQLPTCNLDDIEARAAEADVTSFIIVPDSNSDSSAISVINALMPLGKAIYLTPGSYNIIAMRPRTDMVAGEVLIDVSRAKIPESTVNLKRLGDIAFSSVALLLLAPVYAAIALAVKFSSKGPVVYSQQRIGYKKKPFDIYKFRSMYADAEHNGPSLSTPDDPRITPIGKILRKYRLDELPQFWNVLKGDMSIVGPRPERAYYLDQIIKRAPYYTIVHQVRPGITSWGMVKYGYASTVDEMMQRIQYDMLYIDNVSLAVDIKILFYTIKTVVTGKGL